MTHGSEAKWREKLQEELDQIITDVSESAYKELGWAVQRQVDQWYDKADNYLEDAGDAFRRWDLSRQYQRDGWTC